MLWAVTLFKCGAGLEAPGMAAPVTQTVMHGAQERRAPARDVPEFAAGLRG